MLARKRCTLFVTNVVLRCKAEQLLPAVCQNVRNGTAVCFSSSGSSRDPAEIRAAPAAASTSASVTVTGSGRSAEEDLRQRRREYAEELSRLRKRFAQEVTDKAELKAAALREARKQQRAKTASREVERKESSVVRKQAAEDSKLELMALKGEERAARAERRKSREAAIGAKRAKEQNSLHTMSMDWIEEAELEEKISKSLANPFHL